MNPFKLFPSRSRGNGGQSLQQLLGRARNAYSAAIEAALVEAEMDDLPLPARAILRQISPEGSSLSEVLRSSEISRQHGTYLMDVLVDRGYVCREPDAADRRRMRVTLTERGQAAAEAIEQAVSGIDSTLASHVPSEQIATTRQVLGELANLAPEGTEELESDQGFRRGRRRTPDFGTRRGEHVPPRPDWPPERSHGDRAGRPDPDRRRLDHRDGHPFGHDPFGHHPFDRREAGPMDRGGFGRERHEDPDTTPEGDFFW